MYLPIGDLEKTIKECDTMYDRERILWLDKVPGKMLRWNDVVHKYLMAVQVLVYIL